MPADHVEDGVTLTEVIAGLDAQGYSGSFVVGEDGTTACRTCGSVVAPADLQMDGIRRLEGESDPADMAAVLAVCCEQCDTRGSIIVRYGPEAGPGDVVLLQSIEFERQDALDAAERASSEEPTLFVPPSPTQGQLSDHKEATKKAVDR